MTRLQKKILLGVAMVSTPLPRGYQVTVKIESWSKIALVSELLSDNIITHRYTRVLPRWVKSSTLVGKLTADVLVTCLALSFKKHLKKRQGRITASKTRVLKTTHIDVLLSVLEFLGPRVELQGKIKQTLNTHQLWLTTKEVKRLLTYLKGEVSLELLPVVEEISNQYV